MTSPPTLRDEFMTADVSLVLYVVLGYVYESYLLVKKPLLLVNNNNDNIIIVIVFSI